ncbi:CRISPR-associated endonuclease Cas6 [Bacteroides sp. UBA939]|uniref:CRISPR-associated endonuclease Cas6 n=1 Tax=Bacteroides sp. UBA939 TaxID=1946092 RepID=UPI0025BF657B|nr:CRISPR-associated endonuclease Cas6 [Bacteroides sp. UBA939]
MEKRIPILIVQFAYELRSIDIPRFRGAVIASLGDKADILYHNHTGENFRYSYPLIQYKRIHGKAAIVCIADGAEKIGRFFSSASSDFLLGAEQIKMEIEAVRPSQFCIQLWKISFRYRIRRWLPLNSENYKTYMELDGLKERITFLEKILTGNLLSFTKGLDIHLDEHLECELTAVSEPFYVMNKNVKLMAFDIEFKSNLSVPDYVGIGKNASIGCGVITRIREKIEK